MLPQTADLNLWEDKANVKQIQILTAVHHPLDDEEAVGPLYWVPLSAILVLKVRNWIMCIMDGWIDEWIYG